MSTTDQEKIQLATSEVDDILQNHQLWLSSYKKEGKQADFSNKIIYGYNFSGKQLVDSTFYNAHLYHCGFESTNLTNASFIAAEVVRSNFSNANLAGVDFSWGAVTDCVFEGAKHLTLKCLKRTSLRGSILPADISFEGILNYTDHLIKKARNVFGVLLGATITTLLVVLFGVNGHDNITISLPLISSGISLDPQIGLILNLVLLTIGGAFYSLALTAIQKQIVKIPAIFPDGRFAFETIFPWFWVTWIVEIWQTDYSDKISKHHLWSRLIILSCLMNTLFVTTYSILLLLFKRLESSAAMISSYSCGAGAGATILFLVTIAVAYFSRGKFYVWFAGILTLLTWAFIYYFTQNYEFTILAVYCMIAAWWFDHTIFGNEGFSRDLSVPDEKYHSERLEKIRTYVQPRFEGLNIALGLLLCFLTTLYLYNFKF